MSPSQSQSNSKENSVGFGVDLNRDPIFLSSRLKNSEVFALSMLALGDVVRFTSEFRQKDHSQYQAWVQEQYLIEAGPALAKQKKELDSKQQKLSTLKEERARLENILSGIWQKMSRFDDAQRRYWKWLYDNDRDLWIVLDPIVSVQKNSTYFEAFSQDESTYVLVELPHEELEDSSNLRLGTTNIDFGLFLEREFKRVRSYRPLTLTVGLKEVGIATDVSQATEKKIDLPESWIQGLVQVSAAQTLPFNEIELHPLFVGQIISKLESIKEKTGPRSLKFVLRPNENIRVIIEPWGIEFVDFASNYEGPESVEIRVWGRRRLSLLKNLLPTSKKVTVKLLGDGMPSFWTVENSGIKTTFGFSGWNALDWSKKMQFSALLPREEFDANQLENALKILIEDKEVNPEKLIKNLNLKPSQALSILQTLAFHGKAMYLPNQKQYVYRELVPGWQPEQKAGIEERRGIEFAKKDNYFNSIEREIEAELTTVSGDTEDGFKVEIRRDSDARITYAQCSCSFFNFNKLRLGPCRHIVALGLK